MRRILAGIAILGCCALAWIGGAIAQGRGPTDWMTSGADAQRSSWVRNDPKISSKSLRSPGFKFLWKEQLGPNARPTGFLTPPSLLERLIGYRGFRMLAFVGTKSNKVVVLDSDLGRLEWEKDLLKGRGSVASSGTPSRSCPGGMTAGVTRPTTLAIAPAPNSGSGGGRSNPAKGAVGEPGQGAVTLSRPTPTPRVGPTPTPTPTPRPGRLNPADPPGQFGAGPFLIHALSSDGMLHSLHLSNGNDYQPPMKFIPPNANASGLVVVGNLAYVATQNGCGGVPDGVWALDLTSGKVSSWKAALAGSAGVAFGVDGTIYATTKGGGQLADSLVALDPQTLAVIDWYSPGSGFTSSPVVFEFGGRVLVAASTADGKLHVLDASKPGGEDHKTPLGTALVKSKGQLWPGALASWQDRNKTRWILVPDVLPAGTSTPATGAAAVGAWKLVEQAGKLSLEPGWTSRGIVSPLPPTIINDVVFMTSGGDLRSDLGPKASPRVLSASRAVLYALDGITGEELWNSGSLITSSPRGDALSGGTGQIYVGTNAGVLFAFGFPMEH